MWRTSFLQEAVWLGCNEVWPDHLSKEPRDRHIFFNYDEYPEKLMTEYHSAPPVDRAVDIRLVFDVQGRVRRLMKEAEEYLKEIERRREAIGEPIDLPPVPLRTPVI